jgi:hypothetical protein
MSHGANSSSKWILSSLIVDAQHHVSLIVCMHLWTPEMYFRVCKNRVIHPLQGPPWRTSKPAHCLVLALADAPHMEIQSHWHGLSSMVERSNTYRAQQHHTALAIRSLLQAFVFSIYLPRRQDRDIYIYRYENDDRFMDPTMRPWFFFLGLRSPNMRSTILHTHVVSWSWYIYRYSYHSIDRSISIYIYIYR